MRAKNNKPRGNNSRQMKRKRFCRFSSEENVVIDYKDLDLLGDYITET
jgi:small subunit ribosomal protein S18